ncbi:MAG: nucleotidyl transferase AbiEii/AbiGii toxin family protein [Candidatus Howiella sp.]
MNITAEEKLMYEVMRAIYDSGIPVSFKGSMVLKACLMEADYTEDTRHTVDIDANWNSDTAPSDEQIMISLQNALKKNGIELKVSIYRMHGKGRSAGFELSDKDTDEILFSMDIDVNRPVTPTKIYEVDGLRFRGVSPLQMIADKVSAVSTDKVFRRVKDVVDLYYISKVFDFDKADVMHTLNNSGRSLENFNGFLHSTEDLRHSYEKFRFAGDVTKPPFDEVYCAVKSYIKAVLPKENRRDYER